MFIYVILHFKVNYSQVICESISIMLLAFHTFMHIYTVDLGVCHCRCFNVTVAYAFAGFEKQTSHYQNVHSVGSLALTMQL